MDSNRPDNSRFYEEDDELFLFDSIINEANNSTIPAEDHLSSPFVEEDAEWFRNILDHSDLNTGRNKDTSLPPDPLSSEYTILSRQEARDELKTDRVSPETATTVQNAIGSAGIMHPRQKTKDPTPPAPDAEEPPKVNAAPKISEPAAAESSGVKEKLVRRARMVSGAARPVSQEPDPATSTASTNKIEKKNLQRPTAPVSKTAEPVTEPTASGAPPRVRKTVPVTKPAPSVPAKMAPAAAKTPQPSGKKKGGAHVAPKKKRSFGLFKPKDPETKTTAPAASTSSASRSEPKTSAAAAGTAVGKKPAAVTAVKKPAATTGVGKPAVPAASAPKQPAPPKPESPVSAKQNRSVQAQ